MKVRSILLLPLLLLFNTATAQQFGTLISEDGTLDALTLKSEVADQPHQTIQIKGTIEEVCQVKGCWMTMPLAGDRSMRITFKDYGFFVPKDCSGKTAIIQGELKTETIDVATLRHFAKDAGKSEQEIAAIKDPQSELVFIAEGVLLME